MSKENCKLLVWLVKITEELEVGEKIQSNTLTQGKYEMPPETQRVVTCEVSQNKKISGRRKTGEKKSSVMSCKEEYRD